MTTTTVRAVIDPPAAVRRWAPPAGAVVVAVGLWGLTTTVLSAPHSLLRQAAPQRVAPAIVDLFARGVLLPDIGISLWHLVIGLAVAVVIGIPAGLLLGLSAISAHWPSVGIGAAALMVGSLGGTTTGVTLVRLKLAGAASPGAAAVTA